MPNLILLPKMRPFGDSTSPKTVFVLDRTPGKRIVKQIVYLLTKG